MTDIELLKEALILSRNEKDLSRYVYLREDEKGKYIEYVLLEGAPHDNRCLSKYVTGDMDMRGREVDRIYELSSFTCGGEGREEGGCKVGKPNPNCSYWKPDWSCEHPKKCACWTLDRPLDLSALRVPLTADEIRKLTLMLNDNRNNRESPVGEGHCV